MSELPQRVSHKEAVLSHRASRQSLPCSHTHVVCSQAQGKAQSTAAAAKGAQRVPFLLASLKSFCSRCSWSLAKIEPWQSRS